MNNLLVKISLGFYATLPLVLCLILAIISFLVQKGILRGKSKKYICDRRSLYWKSDKSILIGCLLIASLFLFVACIYIWYHFADYINGMLEKIEAVTGIIIDLTGLAFSLAVALVLFKKGYYLVFSIYDILEEYNFFFWLKGLVATCIFTCILTMVFSREGSAQESRGVWFGLFAVFVLLSLWCFSRVFHITWKVMFSKETRDLKLLEKLYRVYEIENLDYIQMEEGKWKKEAVQVNLEYLLKDYLKNCDRIDVSKVGQINYISTMGTDRKKWYKRSVCVYEIVVIMIYFCGIALLWVQGAEIGKKTIYVTLILLLVEAVFPFVPCENVHSIILYTFWGEEGFYIQEEKNRKTKSRFVSNHPYQLLQKKHIKYLQSFNSLTAFVKVSLEKNASKKIIERVIQKHIDKFHTNPCNVVEVLPYFIIGYFMFEKDRKMESIRELYKKLQLNNEQRFDLQIMLCSYIYYIEKVRKINYMDGNKGRYIRWLYHSES